MGPLAQAEHALAADRRHADPAIWIARKSNAEILKTAKRLEQEGRQDRPLWGIPFAVKDNIDVAGMPTTAACPEFAYVPAHSAPCVERLLQAGALLIGKTNLDQFATGLVGVRSPYGVPRNVFDVARVPGGSSSGSAVAVAAGIVAFALGTDTAGSGRVPAAFGNIVGLKPTIGTVSTRGVVPACRSIDTVSVFAATVDAALQIQRVISGYDAEDPYSRIAPFAHLRRGALPPAPRIAVADVHAVCAPATAALYRRAAQLFDTVTVDIVPFLQVARLLYDGPWVAERTAALRNIIDERPGILHDVTRSILQAGFTRSAVEAFDAFHLLAQVRRQAQQLFAHHDALMLPTTPFTPTLAEVAADPLGVNSRLGTFTNFVNLCDLAAFAVPCGLGADGLPVGVTLLGPAYSEGRLAGLADRVHRHFTSSIGATDTKLPSAASADDVGADETTLFCVGAHMSGLPLNHQITELGGRLLRTDRTMPVYRLYALGPRPGLVRVDDGAEIAGEVWTVPTAAIGALLSQVRAPLGFGTVDLASGPCLGFLAEANAVAGAPDITRLGGWRSWLTAPERQH